MMLLALLLAALTGTAPAAAPVAPDPVAVLHAWDERRAGAWASGDPDALRRLYAPGSAAGAADVEMLRAWQERRLRVEHLRMQVLSVVVRSHERRRMVLVVSDRLASAVAVGDGVRRALPRDEVSTRRLVLVRVAGEWRVGSVTDR